MNRHMQIKIVSNMDKDEPRDVECSVNWLCENGWSVDSKMSTPTRIVLQKWVDNKDKD